MPDSIDAEATSALCREIKNNIFEAIKEVRQAWVHATAEHERLERLPQAPPTGAAGSTLQVPPRRFLAPLFASGAVVVGRVVKHKDNFNNRRGVVTAVLHKHYKVLLQEGPFIGQLHKYLHKDVVAPEPEAATDAEGNPAEATGAAISAEEPTVAASNVASDAATGLHWEDFHYSP